MKAGREVLVGEPAAVADSFWTANRHTALSATEQKAYTNMDSLKNMKSYRRLMDWATFFLAGYQVGRPIRYWPCKCILQF